MGAADVVPGVSGGTVAFITGIYPRLLHALKNFDLYCLRCLLRGDIAHLWRHVDATFLLTLFAGIVTSVVFLARLISSLLENYPEPLWAFFFGLILASAGLLLKQVPQWRWSTLLLLVLGTCLALLVAVSPRGELLGGMPGVFLAGFIAICAMILPGISGSFILVLLGMYGPVLNAVNNFEVGFLFVLAAGAACGLLSFSRLLYWLMERYRAMAVALLTGFLFGSLTAVWPWKRVVSWMVDRHGEIRAAQTLPVSPTEYLVRTGEDPRFLLCLLVACLGFYLVWVVDHRWGKLQVEQQ